MSDVMSRLSAAIADRYRIERELGAGGMATVYLAEDLKHKRKVAVKVLKPELAAVLGAERFVQEITTTAALQHPHILPLFDSGTADGFLFYVMPFIDGETLRSKLDRETQFGVDESVKIAVAVADALDYAHRHGVIHRDIKPENILLHEGRPMVADFGIALALSAAAGGRMTETGLSLGTPHYMSPEQATAEKEISARSDVYSLASVLYEMLAGQPPHLGGSAQQIIMKIITEQAPSVTTLRKSVPLHVAAAVAKALEKLPADRFESAKAFADALGNASYTSASGAARVASSAAPRSVRGRAMAFAPWVLLAAAAVFIATAPLRSRPPQPPPVTRFALRVEGVGEVRDGSGSPIAVSPDGSKIVYIGRDSAGTTSLYLRAMDRDEPVPVAGTRGAIAPFFSPDGQSIGFNVDGKVQKVSLNGGSVTTVVETSSNGLSWGTDGYIYYTTSTRGLERVSESGGRPELVVRNDSATNEVIRFPDALPGGRTVLVTLVRDGGPVLAAVSLADHKLHDLGLPGMYPHFVNGGYVAFVQLDGTLFSVPFDERRLAITGPAVPIENGVKYGPAFPAKMGISRTGTMAFLGGSGTLGNELVIIPRAGKEVTVPSPTGTEFGNPRFSPDGRRLAVTASGFAQGTVNNLWTYDIGGSNLVRLTFDSVSRNAEWAPDGQHLVFTRGDTAVYRLSTDGSGVRETFKVRPVSPPSQLAVLPDGKHVVFRVFIRATGRDIWFAALDSAGAGRPLLQTPFSERAVAVSPDGRWLAYVSNETGTADEIYVRRIEAGSGRWKVTRTGGREPRWGPGGRELYYRTSDSVMAVAMTPGAEPHFGQPRVVLVGNFRTNFNEVNWDIAADGSKMVFVRTPAEPGALAMHVVVHWFDQLRAAPKGPAR